jgi:hypothetical protein
VTDSRSEYKARIMHKLKDDIYKAQKMYLLAQKLENRILPSMSKFSKDNLNRYCRLAKEIDLKLTAEELYNRFFDI